MLHNNTIAYSWYVPEFTYQEKTKNWYWIVGLVALGLIILSLFMRNYLLGFFVLIGTFLMFTQATKQPKEILIEVSESGINIDTDLHKYETIKAFWIQEQRGGEFMLILLTSQIMTPLQSIMLPPDLDPMLFREFLLEFLPEEKLRQSYTERLMHMIGF